jgi:hypothetical protein
VAETNEARVTNAPTRGCAAIFRFRASNAARPSAVGQNVSDYIFSVCFDRNGRKKLEKFKRQRDLMCWVLPFERVLRRFMIYVVGPKLFYLFCLQLHVPVCLSS